MPLPGSLTTITVTGTYLKFDGTPESGVVQFVNQAFLQSASDNIIVAYGTTTVALDATGSFTAVLPATNDPQWVPIGFTYNVYERLSSARRSYVISLPYDGGPVNLADVAPVESVPPIGSFLPLIGGTITGNLGVNGVTTLTNATISGSASIGSNLAVAGNQTITGTLGVTGNTSITNNLSVGGSAVFTGNVTVNSLLNGTFGNVTGNYLEMVAAGLSTGILYGGEVNVSGVNPQAITIGPYTGYIIDTITTPGSPILTRLATTTTTTVPLDAGALTRLVTWFLIDNTGAVIQQATRPTNIQRRTHLQVAEIVYDPGLGQILIDQSLPVTHMNPLNQFYDLMYALGPFNVSGNVISASAANLTFTKTAGVLFAPGFNYFAGPVQTNDPHVSSLAAQNPVTFRHLTQSTTGAVTPTTILDVANYDLNGVITPIGDGANAASIFRVFLASANIVADQVYVQYGQSFYTSVSVAQASLHSENFVVQQGLAENATLIGYIVAAKNATNLSDTAQASFHHAGKFELP